MAKKPAKKPTAAKKPLAPSPRASAAAKPAFAALARASALMGTPTLSAGTGQVDTGGSAGVPLPPLTPPSTPVPAVVAAVKERTPGAALPRGADLDEPRPSPLEIERVVAAPLETGLSDYAFWAEYLATHEPAPPPLEGFRRGRVWV